MKTTTIFTLLAAVAWTIPSIAHEMEMPSKEMSRAQDEEVNPQYKAFKAYVDDALDSHKGKAPQAMKGHHQEMKDYVARALDGQNKRDARILSDTANLSYEDSLQYLIDRAQPMAGKPPLHGPYQAAGCADMGDQTPAQIQCLDTFVNNSDYDACGSLFYTFQYDCTGDHFWRNGNCHNPNFKAACFQLANACGMASGSNNMIHFCEESGS